MFVLKKICFTSTSGSPEILDGTFSSFVCGCIYNLVGNEYSKFSLIKMYFFMFSVSTSSRLSSSYHLCGYLKKSMPYTSKETDSPFNSGVSTFYF